MCGRLGAEDLDEPVAFEAARPDDRGLQRFASQRFHGIAPQAAT